MADNKNYYYLKIKENFYETEEMIFIQNMPDGYLYSDILMKLYLKSLKNNGKLMFREKIPYNSTVLAQVVRHSVGVVEKALNIFRQYELIEVLDNGAIYMLDIQNFIGKSSSEADRKRDYRLNIEKEKSGKLLEHGTNVQTNVGQISDKSTDKTTPEIEIEIEIEKELEIDRKKVKRPDGLPRTPFELIINYFHEICFSLSKVLSLTESRKKTLKKWHAESGIEEIKKTFDMVADSNFLKGNNSKEWKANFDWIIKPANRIKILEGNYKNKEKNGGSENDRYSTDIF
jgi:predicted phage replisome organizer